MKVRLPLKAILIQVEHLLRLSYKSLLPRGNSTGAASEDGMKYVNLPSESMDYDNTYHEAKTLFREIFGEDEDFLIRDEDDNVDMEE
jgi:hypothetical protein